MNGESCLGYPACEPSKIVLLTEEQKPALLEGLEAAGLTGTRDLHVMTRYAARAVDWPALVSAADAEATAIGARVLMVDTLPGVARLKGDAENSSGHALAALQPLQETQTPGLAKFIIRHTRKGGGDLVEAGRGSSAFAGEADVLLSISRPKKSGPTVRRLEALGRFDAIPPVLTVERVTHAIGKSSPPYGSALPHLLESYRIADAPVTSSIAERLDDILPRTTSEAMTADTLASQLSVSSRAVRDALGQGNQVRRVGAGKNGDPRRYFRFLSEIGAVLVGFNG